jgi:hypothetical protein
MENDNDEKDIQRVIEVMIPISDELKDKLENRKSKLCNDDIEKKCYIETNSKQTWVDACKYYEAKFGVRIHPSRYIDEYKTMYKYNRQCTDYDGYNSVPRDESDITTYTEPYVSDLDILFAYLIKDKANILPEKTKVKDVFIDYYNKHKVEKFYNECRKLFRKLSQVTKNLVK